MQVPEWIVVATFLASFFAGLIAQTIVRVRIIVGGGSLLREWALGVAAFTLTVVTIWAIYFAVGYLVS